jgi:hypothetical protein
VKITAILNVPNFSSQVIFPKTSFFPGTLPIIRYLTSVVQTELELERGLMADFCEHDNEFSASLKAGNFLTISSTAILLRTLLQDITWVYFCHLTRNYYKFRPSHSS